MVCPISDSGEVYVIGNPPYGGSRKQNSEQKSDLKYVFNEDYKSLDYVCAWFYKGAEYIRGHNSKCAFVSTNSISQGILAEFWKRVLVGGIEIGFAYPSFKWKNHAKGNAGVTVVIVGIRNESKNDKYLFEDKYKKVVKNINSYLEDGHNLVVVERAQPISNLPIMTYGNMPLEGGFLRFDEEEFGKISAIQGISKFIKNVIGGEEFLSGKNRYCFWIENEDLDEALKISEISNRIDKVRKFRISGGEVARTLANKSHQFRYRHIPKVEQIIVPCTSSEGREYIPCGIFDKNYISLNSIQTIYDCCTLCFWGYIFEDAYDLG